MKTAILSGKTAEINYSPKEFHAEQPDSMARLTDSMENQMITMNTTDWIDFNSPEWLQAKADLEQKIITILAKRNVERAPEQVSDLSLIHI